MGDALISRPTFDNKKHTHTVNDLINTYFYEMNIFDLGRYTYANMHHMIYDFGYYMGTIESDIELLFVYSRNGTEFKKIKVSDKVTSGITTAIFTLVNEQFETNIVLLYGGSKYTLPVMFLDFGENSSFTKTDFLTAPNMAKSPDGLQYISGVYYLNEGYGYSSSLIGGIWTSEDGLTWNRIYDGACDKLLIKDQTFWMSQPSASAPAPSLTRGVYTSSNMKNWTCVWNPDDFSDNQGTTDFQYINGEFVFTTYYSIYKSSDGLNWEKIIPIGVGSSAKNNLTYDNTQNQWLWYSCNTSSSTIYKSYDLTNWEPVYSYSTTANKDITSIVPTSNKIILYAQNLYKSWHILIHDDTSGFFMPLTSGGTGAYTKEQARINLDVYSKSEVDAIVADIISKIKIN